MKLSKLKARSRFVDWNSESITFHTSKKEKIKKNRREEKEMVTFARINDLMGRVRDFRSELDQEIRLAERAGLVEVSRHGEHDQSSHGNKGGGSKIGKSIKGNKGKKMSEWLKKDRKLEKIKKAYKATKSKIKKEKLLALYKKVQSINPYN